MEGDILYVDFQALIHQARDMAEFQIAERQGLNTTVSTLNVSSRPLLQEEILSLTPTEQEKYNDFLSIVPISAYYHTNQSLPRGMSFEPMRNYRLKYPGCSFSQRAPITHKLDTETVWKRTGIYACPTEVTIQLNEKFKELGNVRHGEYMYDLFFKHVRRLAKEVFRPWEQTRLTILGLTPCFRYAFIRFLFDQERFIRELHNEPALLKNQSWLVYSFPLKAFDMGISMPKPYNWVEHKEKEQYMLESFIRGGEFPHYSPQFWNIVNESKDEQFIAYVVGKVTFHEICALVKTRQVKTPLMVAILKKFINKWMPVKAVVEDFIYPYVFGGEWIKQREQLFKRIKPS